MTFLNGITNLTNWMGNVIMPTVAGLFFALAVIRYARGYPAHPPRQHPRRCEDSPAALAK